ncbi:class GN sortase [Paraglaciecola chathamensis]|uniref:Class GN sortase n=1 Tax=Paraglaciecola chathamensis TaxID=368405 RepID=A0ABS0WG24_9ALTE|nr:class GN sortase [Paraglaciecola chathamensis]MBJ2137424.1 class GN sortase [Paraglaciecola chathamensis]
MKAIRALGKLLDFWPSTKHGSVIVSAVGAATQSAPTAEKRARNNSKPLLQLPSRNACLTAIWLACFVSSGLLLSNGAYMWAKAQLAQVLIAHAWQSSVQAAETNTLLPNANQTFKEQSFKEKSLKTKPWPWADTYPVVKIQFYSGPTSRFGSQHQARQQKLAGTRQKKLAAQPLYVLAGASGRTMAFGPGHMSATPLPLEGGNSVITGHRDTHFAALQYLNPGDLIHVQTLEGQGEYQVTATFIVHQSQTQIIESNYFASSSQDQLTLITCYPFHSLVPNPTLRYVVSANRVR